MQTRGTFPALNDHRSRSPKRKKIEVEPHEPGQSGFKMRRQPSTHTKRNPRGLAARRDFSRALSKGRR